MICPPCYLPFVDLQLPCSVSFSAAPRLIWVWSDLRQGKLEMEIEVLTEEEAEQRPAGVAREEPNTNPALPEPK